MSYSIPMRILGWVALLGLFPSIVHAFTDYALCERALSVLTYRMQRGALGVGEDDPLAAAIRDQSGQWTAGGKVTAEQWRREFEEDVLEFLVRGASEARWQEFEKKYGLSREQALDVLTYYASRQFFNVLPQLGKPRDVLKRLSEVSREHRLGNAQSEAARTYPYYLHNLTRWSVPQIAEDLSQRRKREVEESEVYAELSSLGISIEGEFRASLNRMARRQIERNLQSRGLGGLVKELPDSLLGAAEYLEANVPTLRRREIARILGIGDEALDYIQHATNNHNRGLSWNRVGEFNGETLPEEKILERLWNEGKKSKAIAEELNQIFKTSPGHKDYRSQASVSGKARLLGLTEPPGLRGGEVKDPTYGVLKKANGELDPETVIPYLYDHYDRPLSRLAADLGVSVSGLRAFMTRHDLILPRPRSGQAKSLLTEQQRQALMDPVSGLLAQLGQNLKGFSKADQAIEAFARQQISDPQAQGKALEKIRALGINPADGTNAQQGRKAPQDRLHEALQIIAEAKTGQRPSVLLTREHGTQYFGFK
jgi:hypothetical protein